MSFAHQSGAGGVSVHGLLSGLDADDHTQYALADKTRPSPWVAAGDLSARSLADLGTRAHDLLTGLGDDDHSIYALLSGRSGGQTLIGGADASERLTLQSTAHATRGYVRAQDDLQLLSNILRGSDGSERLRLAAASPHILLTGQTRITGDLAIGIDPSTSYGLYLTKALVGSLAGEAILAYCDGTTMAAAATGLYGFAYQRASALGGLARGLDFQAMILAAATGAGKTASGIRTGVNTQAGSYTVANLYGLQVVASLVGPAPTTLAAGIDVADYGQAGSALVYGVRIADQTLGTLRRCLEVGPIGAPYLRILGGWTGVANQTPAYLVEGVGPTLRQIQWVDPGNAGVNLVAGQRLMVLV